MTTAKAVADAYGRGAAAWAEGPTRLYRRLADLLVAFSPEVLTDKVVLDLGSGTGVGSRAAIAVGARVFATDLAPAMLHVDQAARPPSAAADARALPFRDRAFDVVLAPFALNHLDDPSEAVHETRRVAHLLLASTYAEDDDHPAKGASEVALAEAGWTRPEWYARVKAAMQAWGTTDSATAMVERGGLTPLRVERIEVEFGDLAAEDMVAWRLGLAHAAPYLASVDEPTRRRVTERTLELLGPHPDPVVRKVIFIAAAA